MGMGSAPCHAWTISLDGLKAVCPQAVETCETTFEALGYTWDAFAFGMEREAFDDLPDDVDPEEIVNAWEKLQAAFKKATKVGESHLELGIGYYASDDGDQYDDLEEGCYFTVEGVTCLTPAGEQFGEHLKERSWTVFG